MRLFLTRLREWTLPVAITSGMVIYCLFAFIPALEPTAAVAEPVIDTIFPLFLFLVLLVTFCRVDFHKMRPVKWHLRVGLVQLALIALPVATMMWRRVDGDVLVTMECVLMCVIAPCASAAPVVTARLDGNLEQMTTYVFLSNLVTAALIPAVFPLIDPQITIPFLDAFLMILKRVASILLLPMALAYVIKHYIRPLHRVIVRYPDLSFYFWACSLVIISGTTLRNIVRSDATGLLLAVIAVLALVACLGQFALGRLIGHSDHLHVETGQALGQKNTAFAIWIAGVYLNPLSTVGPGCYILWQNIINAIELYRHDVKNR